MVRWLGAEDYRPLEDASPAAVELEAPDAPFSPPGGAAARVGVPPVLEREAPSRGARRGRRLLRLLSVNDPAAAFYGSALANLPQVTACACVFVSSWASDRGVCDAGARARWRVWGAVHAVRLLAAVAVAGARWRSHARTRAAAAAPPDARADARADARRLAALAGNARNVVDAAALIWFVVGNMWLLGGADKARCSEASRSPIYVVDVAMLLIQYAQICLPCLFAVAMVPVFCFCLPCVIRLLASLRNPAAGDGASERDLAKLPKIPYAEDLELLKGQERACSVCLCDYEDGDTLRALPCGHLFHAECADQWLTANATCPLCRTSLFGEDPDDEEGGAGEGADDDAEAPLDRPARDGAGRAIAAIT